MDRSPNACLRRWLLLWLAPVLSFLMVSSVLIAQESGSEVKNGAATSASEVKAGGQESDQPAQSTKTVQQEETSQEAETIPITNTKSKELNIAWDTTLKYSNMFRVKKPNPRLAIFDPTSDIQNFNNNQGLTDINFHRGLISNRVDALSELDITYGDWGARFSGATWVDPSYNRRTANPFPGYSDTTTALTNGCSADGLCGYNHFNKWQKSVLYQYGELLDAFVFGKVSVGNPRNVLSFRAGQFAQVWGQTLFFGGNGIAGGMVPVDVEKASAVPNSQTKEIMRPLPQVSGQLQLGPKVAIAAYYQFRWVSDRLPPAGGYFAGGGDFMMPGGESFSLMGMTMYRKPNIKAPNGAEGVQVLLQGPFQTDLGFHYIRYNDFVPGTVYFCMPTPAADPNCISPTPAFGGGTAGEYVVTSATNINAYALSASKSIGVVNYALEVGGRTHANLMSDGQAVTSMAQYNNTNRPGWAIGDSLHVNFSGLAVFKPNRIAKESSLLAEVAWNDLLSITKNPQMLDPRAKKQSLAFQGVYSLTYRRIFRDVDFMPQIGFSYSPLGKASVAPLQVPERGGNVAPGFTASYRDAWRLSFSYNHYYGPVYPQLNMAVLNGRPGAYLMYGQNLADRDFISLSIFRSFGAHYSGKTH